MHQPTLALVHYLATRVGQLPMIIVGTYCDSALDMNPTLVRTLEELLRMGLRPLKLQGLSQEAVGQLLQSLSHREPSPQLVHVMFAETQGNPFFVEELYRHLVAEGKVVEEAGALRAEVSVAELGGPDNVRLVLGRRLERLGEEARAVVYPAPNDFTNSSNCSERYTAWYCGDAVSRKRPGGCRVAARTALPPRACPGAEP